MTDDYTTRGGRNANFGRDQSLSKQFNDRNKLAEQIANLSPEGQKKCEMIGQLAEERLEAEKRNQQRSHGYRVLKQKVELLENYIRGDLSQRPPEIQADPTPDLKIIDEQAERMVAQREEFFLGHIEREAAANMRQVIVGERQTREFRREDASHEPEQEL